MRYVLAVLLLSLAADVATAGPILNRIRERRSAACAPAGATAGACAPAAASACAPAVVVTTATAGVGACAPVAGACGPAGAGACAPGRSGLFRPFRR